MISAFDDGTPLSELAVRCIARLDAGFRELLKAIEYAVERNVSRWQFAVDIACLRRFEFSNNDLRWLVAAGFLTHGVETTSVVDASRSFQCPDVLEICDKSCFVLTQNGIAVSGAIWAHDWTLFTTGNQIAFSAPKYQITSITEGNRNGVVANYLPTANIFDPQVGNRPVEIDHQAKPSRPHWDRDRQELLVGSIVVKRFRVPAVSQEAILAAFEEDAWPPRIDDPLPPRRDQSPKRRLQETIKSLNRNQKHPLVRFQGDGTAQGVLWEFI